MPPRPAKTAVAVSGQCRHIGLIGGLGVSAAAAYYTAIARGCMRRGVIPRVTMAHAHAPTVVALAALGRVDELADYLASFAAELERGGAELLAIPAVTPHMALGALRQRVNLPIIDILSATTDGLRRRGVARVALLGTRTTIEHELFGALSAFEVILPTSDEIDEIHRIYIDVASRGHTSVDNVNAARQIAQTLLRRDQVDVVLLAGTDLCVIASELSEGLATFDCAAAHIEAILTAAVKDPGSKVSTATSDRSPDPAAIDEIRG